MYTPGKLLMHKFSKKPVWVLKMGKEQVLCRTMNLDEVWLYEFELMEPTDEVKNFIENELEVDLT